MLDLTCFEYKIDKNGNVKVFGANSDYAPNDYLAVPNTADFRQAKIIDDEHFAYVESEDLEQIAEDLADKKVFGISGTANDKLYFWDDIDWLGAIFSESTFEKINLNHLDVSRVETMEGIFEMSQAKEIHVEKWNTANVTAMSALFRETKNLKHLDLTSWNTHSVEDMSFMFESATALEELDLSEWETSAVQTMQEMFSSAGSLKSLNLSGWTTRDDTELDSMFANTPELSELVTDNKSLKNQYSTDHGRTA